MKQNITAALLFASLNAFALSSMSLFAKLMGDYYGPIEVTFFRNLASFALLVILLLALREIPSLLKTKRPWAHFIRSAIGTTGMIFGMWSYQISPLALATLLYFTSPLFVALLSYPVLGEKVGPYRIASVVAGFVGVAIIALPAFSEYGAAAGITVLGVIVGIIYGFSAGCVDLCLRYLGDTESSKTTTFYFLLFGIIATGLYWPFSEYDPYLHSQATYFIIAGLGITGIVSLLAKSQSFRLAPASFVAPVAFTMIIWAGLFDYFIWDKLPGWPLILGGTIIIASNLVIAWREQRKKIKENENTL
ncbi:MAG: DMT family transporter [Alphaproteobacteria bacterium]